MGKYIITNMGLKGGIQQDVVFSYIEGGSASRKDLSFFPQCGSRLKSESRSDIASQK